MFSRRECESNGSGGKFKFTNGVLYPVLANPTRAISFFKVLTILQDIFGFYTIYDIITRYLQYVGIFKIANKLQELQHSREILEKYVQYK